MSKIFRFALCAFVVVGLFACTDKAPEKPAAKAAVKAAPKVVVAPKVDAQALLGQKCTSCHTSAKWEGRLFSPAQWEEMLLQMRVKGADFTDEDLKILKHLVK